MTNQLAIPAPQGVRLDPAKTSLLLLDITDPICTKRPACVESVPRIAALLERTRASGAGVVHTMGPRTPTVILNEVAPLDTEPVIVGRADKFYGTDLDHIFADHGTEVVVMLGTAANGAVLYTAFSANLRGYTVVVAGDAITSDDAAITEYVKWQLLNQPGMVNRDNQPLVRAGVTLSSTELIEFGN